MEYIEELDQHLFRGKLMGGLQRSVIIKFTETYGGDVHKVLADKEMAPALFHIGNIGRFAVVVMEELKTGLNIGKYLKQFPSKKEVLKAQAEIILQTLRECNFVHGDLRDPNIMVHNGRMKVLDFDWAGKAQQARYPYYLNHDQIKWPNGASDGNLIEHKHDEHWIKMIFS